MVKSPVCTDPAACNYTPGADTNDSTCQVPGGPCDDGLDTTGNDTVQADCTCAGLELGCTDEAACNYALSALLDDGSCTYPGCTDLVGINYDPTAGCDNWRLVPDLLLLIGNYSCMGDCGTTDLNGDSSVDAADLLTFLGLFGTACE